MHGPICPLGSRGTAMGMFPTPTPPATRTENAWARYARGLLLQVLQVGLQNTVGGCSRLQVRLDLCQLLGGRGERRSW